MSVELPWTLELLAAVAYCKSVWEIPEIKTKINQVFNSLRYYHIDSFHIYSQDGLRPMWRKGKKIAAVIEVLVKKINEDNLPVAIHIYVTHIVQSMVKKIFDWAEYLLIRFGKKINNCADTIRWTSVGTIDEVRVIQKWILAWETEFKNRRDVFRMADQYAQVDFMETNSEEIKQIITRYHSRSVIWMNMENQSEAQMFHKAIIEGYDVAVKFLWYKLPLMEREENLMSYATVCVESHKNHWMSFVRKKRAEILVFLMSKMSIEQTREFLLNKKIKILSMLLSDWPAQDFFLFLFDSVKDTFSDEDYLKILFDIVKRLKKNFDLKLNSQPNFYFELFASIWLNIPKSIKQKFLIEIAYLPCWRYKIRFFTCFNLYEIVQCFYHMFNLQGLKLLINDEDLKLKRDYLIELGKPAFQKLVKHENFEAIDLFMLEIFSSKEEKEKFKLSLNFYEYLIVLCNQLSTADKLLNWQLGSKDNRKEFISAQVNCEEIFRKLIIFGKYATCDKFLNWVFETEEERENFRSNYISDDLIKERIYCIYEKGYKIINIRYIGYKYVNRKDISKKDRKDINREKETLGFLKWIFKSNNEKITQFKREKLIKSGKCVQRFCQKTQDRILSSVTRNKRKDVLEEFLNFCEIPEEKVREFKKSILESIPDFILTDYESKTSFSVIEFLLDWSAENNKQKTIVIKSLMSSADIASVWDSINFYATEEKVKFHNEWVKGSPNISKYKNEMLTRIRKNSATYYSFEQRFLKAQSIYEKLENGDDVNFNDLKLIEDLLRKN